jgi:predicted lactoylglutathione lyase
MTKIIASSPHFLVKDVVAACACYQDKLGFTIPEYWGEPPTFAMPRRDKFIVMLNQVGCVPPHPNGKEEIWDAYFWCNGVDELFDEFTQSGADIFHEPVNREVYGMREIAVRDLDGYLLVFAEEIEGES